MGVSQIRTRKKEEHANKSEHAHVLIQGGGGLGHIFWWAMGDGGWEMGYLSLSDQWRVTDGNGKWGE